jgi:nicotinamide riboside kinase
MIITLLGAESTGKSDLARALTNHLQSSGKDAVTVDEYLRE